MKKVSNCIYQQDMSEDEDDFVGERTEWKKIIEQANPCLLYTSKMCIRDRYYLHSSGSFKSMERFVTLQESSLLSLWTSVPESSDISSNFPATKDNMFTRP